MLSEHKTGIDSIDDSVVQASFYKLQGDIALIDGNLDKALSLYRKGKNSSKGSSLEVKFQLDIVSVLLNQEDYNSASRILEDILNIDDVGYNEKNKAEEFLAYVKHKLDT